MKYFHRSNSAHASIGSSKFFFYRPNVMYLRNFRLDRYQQKALAVELYLYIEDLNTCEDHIVVDVTVLGMSQRNHWK